jgi:S1-C subfamily serine protease
VYVRVVALISFFAFPVWPAWAGDQDLNTQMMLCTFKIADGQSTGTAWIVGKPVDSSEKQGYRVLVTANHVLENMKADTATLYLRRKDAKGNYGKMPFPFAIRKAGKRLWTRHPEVDIAVMYASLPTGVEISGISTSVLGTDQELQKYEIHPGDDLCCLGYPLNFEANDAGFPILRSGRIASYPILPTRATRGFLLDFEVFPGNSGGPAYIVKQSPAYGGATHFGEPVRFIVGLVLSFRTFRL